MILEINTSAYEKLGRSFYEQQDVVTIARQLIGKYLFTNVEGVITAGKIVETEAYSGRGDKACHANNKKTPRTEIMYGKGGFAYIYLCYGIHHLFNVVTNVSGLADAVLIRALEPVLGLKEMNVRRGSKKAKLASGPGTLSEALGIKTNMTGYDLTGEVLWISEGANEDFEVESDVRIGVDYAGEDAFKPWRFLMKGNEFVSKKKVENKKARVD